MIFELEPFSISAIAELFQFSIAKKNLNGLIIAYNRFS